MKAASLTLRFLVENDAEGAPLDLDPDDRREPERPSRDAGDDEEYPRDPGAILERVMRERAAKHGEGKGESA